MAGEALTFESLVQVILSTHQSMASQAVKAVNAGLTLRNWLIGFHIEEYARKGTDRAT